MNSIKNLPLISLEQLVDILKGSKSAKELIREARENESRFD